jgi:hypothetical protein
MTSQQQPGRGKNLERKTSQISVEYKVTNKMTNKTTRNNKDIIQIMTEI